MTGIDELDRDRRSALHMAAQQYSVEAARLLLDAGGADRDLVNAHGQTPRGLAHLIGNYDVKQFYRSS
jgi:ankyrin repeat protein